MPGPKDKNLQQDDEKLKDDIDQDIEADDVDDEVILC